MFRSYRHSTFIAGRAARVLLAAVLCAGCAADPARGGARLASAPVFAPDSFWYRPLPARVRLDPKSAQYTAELLRQIHSYYGTVHLNVNAYSSPVYVAPAGTPTVRVRVWDCQHRGYTDSRLQAQWMAVPVPRYAQAAAGSDKEMTVYQPSTDSLWEFWQMRLRDGVWEACWGGRMTHTSRSSGIWPHPYGATATGLPFIGGQITAGELARGEIRHVIGISLVDLERAEMFAWPANRSDGRNPRHSANRIPAGTRLRLDPRLDVDALRLHPVARTIAKAAQIYGFVVWDTAGVVSLRLQNSQSYLALGQVNPYPALFRGVPEHAVLAGFPWASVQFLAPDAP
jgi:hypothetical protein